MGEGDSGSLREFHVNNQVNLQSVSNQTLVELNDVNFSYDSRAILKGINMSFPKGKLVAVMGLSGCGKTTILRHIGGVLKPTKGYVKVDGQVIHELDQQSLYKLRRKMGMLFQFGALFTDMTVFDNVAFQMREHTALPEEIIRDLVMMKLHAVGLYGTQDLFPAELSGGKARRVALARTIALDPMLIMYDEPFAGLDPISLTVVGELIRRLNDALGATSIVVTHDVQESLKIVDYVYFISDGAIIAEGSADEIRNSGEAFVRQFVHGEMDGPIPFHYPGCNFSKDLGVRA